MSNRPVARVGVDYADSVIVSGAKTVYTNEKLCAHAGSVTARGSAVVQGARTVFVENRPLARAADSTTRGPIKTGSLNVFASDNNKVTPIEIT